MQILGGSIDLSSVAREAGDLFLHAGYISAYPRTVYPSGYAQATPSVELDLVDAFRLQAENTVATAHGAGADSLAGAVGNGSGSIWPAVLAVAAFFGVLLATWLYRDKLAKAGVGARALLVLLMAGSFLPLATCDEDPALPNEVPWAGVETQAYANPEMATQALLHGILYDGIANVGQPIDSLANIQDEVGLPTSEPTEGMAYALSTYGLDGWGKEFRLTELQDGSYEVRSGGADGVMDNSDDFSITVAQCDKGNWDFNRHAFFVIKHEEAMLLMFHRWSGDLFEYNDKATAQEISGDVLFDAFDTSAQAEMKTKAEEVYNKYSSDHKPLIMQVLSDVTYI